MRLMFLTIITFGFGCAADLRPDSLQEAVQPSAHQSQTAKAMFAQMAEHHGNQKWIAQPHYQVVARDVWQGLAKLNNGWPDHNMHMLLTYQSNTFNGRLDVLSGDHEGLVWAVKGAQAYEGNKQAIKKSDDDGILFTLPAMQYLYEIALRGPTIQLLAYAGTTVLDGKEYDTILGSWGSFEPNDSDQYVYYLDPKTKQLDRLAFTIRDQNKIFDGAIYYEDYRRVQGVLFPHRMVFRFSTEGSSEDFAHLVTVESVSFSSEPYDVAPFNK